MKKVKIMSMQRIINYGSFLQAYGLKKTIESLGYEVRFIDYKYETSIVKYDVDTKFFDKIIKNINIIEFIKRKRVFKEFKRKYNNNYLKLLNVNNVFDFSKDFDTLVIGSDEVFNCLQPYPVGYSKNLFGGGFEDKKVISYAASFGHTTLSELKNHKIALEIGDLLKKFHSISVRDENSYKIVKELTKQEPFQHFDPVLISNYDSEINNNRVEEKNYIIVYAYTGRLTAYEERYIKTFAKKRHKKIISLGFYQRIADENIVVNPFKVLSYFKNADYVITDTFHGTIFSIKMNTKFCTIIRDSNFNKLSSLLKSLDQEDRMVKNLDDINRLYDEECNFTNTNKIILNESLKSIKYLKDNL